MMRQLLLRGHRQPKHCAKNPRTLKDNYVKLVIDKEKEREGDIKKKETGKVIYQESF
jgi:hypothetical protein